MSVRTLGRRRGARALAWLGMPTLVALRGAIAFADLPPRAELLLSDCLVYLLPMVLVIVSSMILALRTRTGAEYRIWAMVFLATTSLFISETYWTWYAVTVDFRGPPLPSPMSAFGVAAAFFYGSIIVSMTRYGQRPRSARIKLLVDVLAAMTIAYAAAYLFWTLPAMQGLESATEMAAWAAAWPVFGATILGVILAIMIGFKTYLWRPWERLIALSNVVFAVGLLLFPVWLPDLKASDALEVGWYGLILGAGLYLLFVAAIYRVTASDDEALGKDWPTPTWRLRGFARTYPVVATLALPAIGWAVYEYGGSGSEGPLLGAGVVLAVLLAARSWIATLEVGHYRLTAVTDLQTGAYNAGYFQQQLRRLIGFDAGGVRTLGLALVDIDDFGRIDRVHGRAIGDRILALCADAIKTSLGQRGEVFRLQADEFAALLPGADVADVAEIADKIVGRVGGAPGEGLPGFSVSIGVAAFPEHALEPESLVTAARIALERSRSDEGGPVTVFDPLARAEQAMTRGTRSSKALRDAVRSLAAAVDARDPATRHHSSRVAELARRFAQVLGLPERSLRLVENAALVHDVGKVGVSEWILRTPGRVSREQAAVDEHAQLGERILAANGFDEVATIVRHHHERWDGRGLPDGLSRDDIPLESRILAICNSYANLTTGGMARATSSAGQALGTLDEGAGVLFDPELTAAFRTMIVRSSSAEGTEAPLLTSAEHQTSA